MSYTLLEGDVLERLRELPDESVHCVVTSPPYYGLRDYGVAGQIGLETTPAEFIAKLTEVFHEVRRVLRSDGTCWINMGDSYAGGGGGNYSKSPKQIAHGEHLANIRNRPDWLAVARLKPKDLMGMPWRLAFALQDDGWWLRQDIIWAKPNPMPESVTDRCTKAHEYVFLLVKSERYHYDAISIREAASAASIERYGYSFGGSKNEALVEANKEGIGVRTRVVGERNPGVYRNKRSVWEIATEPYAEAHFATFPTKLVEPCILAGCPVGGTVLDPFSGSGTTGVVALRHGREYIGIELNPEYAEMSRRRLDRYWDVPLPKQVEDMGPLFAVPVAE